MIALIDNYDSFVYNLHRYIKESGQEVVLMRNDAVDYELLEKCDGIVLSPGPGLPTEAGELMKVIQRFVHSKSILGVCLGHQALAEFFGGKLRQLEAPIHGKSSVAYLNGDSKLHEGLPAEIEVGRYHSWCVDESSLPQEILLSGKLEGGELMSMEHQSLPIFGLQYHPESILTPQGRTLISNWIKTIDHV